MTTRTMSSLRAALTSALLSLPMLAANVATTQAQDYPSRTIRIVVPFSAGGPVDLVGRVLAEKMSDIMKTRVYVENKPGASTQIGIDTVLNSEADGYTVLLSTQSGAIVSLTNKGFQKDLKKELRGVIALASYPILFTVHTDVPAKTFQELVAYSKANPSKLNFGAQGSSDLLAVEALKEITGLSATTIRYGGGGPVSTALIKNEIDFATFALSSMKQFIDSGKIRPLAVLGPNRINDYPDVPSMDEVGAPGFEFASWSGFLVKSSTPDAIVKTIHDAAATALADPEVNKRLNGAGLAAMKMSSDEFTRYWIKEIDRWSSIADRAGFKPQ